jgi:hypothetical protein
MDLRRCKNATARCRTSAGRRAGGNEVMEVPSPESGRLYSAMDHAEYPPEISNSESRRRPERRSLTQRRLPVGNPRFLALLCAPGPWQPEGAMTAMSMNVRPYDSAVNTLLRHPIDPLCPARRHLIWSPLRRAMPLRRWHLGMDNLLPMVALSCWREYKHSRNAIATSIAASKKQHRNACCGNELPGVGIGCGPSSSTRRRRPGNGIGKGVLTGCPK